jgi:hypothetical protein
MANGTLKVQNIETSSGSGTITLGQSGETVSVGTTLEMASGKNQKNLLYPSFAVYGSNSGQTLSDNTDTKVQFETEVYDTDDAFSTSDNRFTVPSNKAGKYFFNVNLYFEGRGENDYRRFQAAYRKNGGGLSLPSTLHLARENYSNPMRANGVSFSIILDLAVSDYVEVYALQDNSANASRTLEQAYFQGFRIGD